MRIVTSPWRAEFNKLVASARNKLRIVAPFYSKALIKDLLKRTKKAVAKDFVLMLSEKALIAGAQSTSAIDLIRNDSSCRIRFSGSLHAKFIVADNKAAIVTSSNLTRSGLESNYEMGVHIDDSMVVTDLIRSFDDLWSDSDEIDTATLKEFARIEGRRKGRGKRDRVFGRRKKLAKIPVDSPPPPPGTAAPGWIAIHSSKMYGGEGQPKTPRGDLRDVFYSGLRWHWTLPRPLKEGGPYRLLLAWDKAVFGEAIANVTRQVDRGLEKEFNFAFALSKYKELRTPVPFAKLSLGKRERWHRSLIRLDDQILAAFDRQVKRS